MIRPGVFAHVGVADGAEVPAFAWPGGYPVIYITDDGDVLCADCTNGKHGSDARTSDSHGWNVVGADVFYEGAPEHCAHCNTEIESAYGDPDISAHSDDPVTGCDHYPCTECRSKRPEGEPDDTDDTDTDDDEQCPECQRSNGPHYRGPCEHDGGAR